VDTRFVKLDYDWNAELNAFGYRGC
jgi:hypothetical protein